jgi:hypothetical protein
LNCDDIDGSVKVIGEDVYGLDKDGIGCEDNEFSGGNNNANTKVIQKTTVMNSASSTAAEVSRCKLEGSSDGILQKFDSVKYQACRLYVDGQKAYFDGFIIGCTQIGNTQPICQALVDSSILNTKVQTTPETLTEATSQSTQQGIQPAAVSK